MVSAISNSCLSLVYCLGSLLCRIQKRNHKTKTEIGCSTRAPHVCADPRTEICDL